MPAYFYSDTEQAQFAAELQEAIGLSRELGDHTCLATALRNLASIRLNQGRFDDADPLAEEAFPLFLAVGATDRAVFVGGFRIRAAVARGELATAEALLAANQTLAPATATAFLRSQEAEIAEARGDIAEARRLWGESIRIAEVEQGEQGPDRLTGLVRLALVALRQEDTRAAVIACAQNLAVQRLGPSRFLPTVLCVLVLAAERAGLLSLSARLAAAIAAGTLQPLLGSAALVHLLAEHQAAAERVRSALGEAAFAAAWAAGKMLSADAAIELGLAAVAELQRLPATVAGQGA